MSDLYIFENDSYDFILSQTVDSQITCPEDQQLPQSGLGKASHDCDTHVLMYDSAGIVTQCHRGSSEERAIEDSVSEVSQHEELGPPAANAFEVDLMSVNDVRLGKVEVDGLTLHQQRSNSPVELWLDACQYLTSEETEDLEVLDKTGHLDLNDTSFLPKDTYVSDYSPEGSERIGWLSDDTRSWGPPVERWSSVDSWASALSDWVGIIEAPPEDITAAFTEIGAEIDALTQALEDVNTHIESEKLQRDLETTVQEQAQQIMGVQDQPLMTQNIPESAIHSEHSCLALCLEAGSELHNREDTKSIESLCDPALTTKDEEPQNQQEKYPTLQHSFMDSSHVASPGEHSLDETDVPVSFSGLDLSQFDGYLKAFESHIFTSNEDRPVELNITEDRDFSLPEGLPFEEPFRDGLFQVTGECSVPQLGSVAAQQVDCEGNKCTTDFNFLSAHTSTTSDVPGVDTQPDLHAHVSSNILPDLAGPHQVAPQLGVPEFIMPLAPLSGGSSLIYWLNSSLEGDQSCTKRSLNDSFSCDHVQLSPCPTPDGITDKPALKGDDEQNHKKQNTTSAVKTPTQETHADDISESLFTAGKTETEETTDLSRELANFTFFPADHIVVSEENRVAYITLDLNDPFVSRAAKPIFTDSVSDRAELEMPHKTHKNPSESKTRSKKEKSSGHHDEQASKKQESISHLVSTQNTGKLQESHPIARENHSSEKSSARLEAKEAKLLIETVVGTEKVTSKPHSKKKKKHGQNTTVKNGGEQSTDLENGAKPKTAKGRIDMFEAKLCGTAGKAQKDADQSVSGAKMSQQPVAQMPAAEPSQHYIDLKDHKSKILTGPRNDETIKKRRVTGDKFGKIVSTLESKLPKTDASVKVKVDENQTDVGGIRKKAYSEVVKQNIVPKEDPKVVQPIQAESVSGDPQSLCLWCQFSAVFCDYTVTWSREGTILTEIKRSAGDESRVSLTISNASHKDLGRYQCRLSGVHGSITLDYLLTYEVLSEIVIPLSPKAVSSAPVDVCSEEEDAQCSKLLFKENFLSDQYFGEKHPISIITEKVHFGEGMHRRAFRTKLHAGQIPLLVPGHSCVLKVHNAISYGTKNNDELIEKNFSLAVEECQVQNTAREYIKAYNAAAQSVEAFGDIPEIIPIYLVHRPSNDIPYATLEEELIGDFVKYSVKDGKEINLMRRDSEAGQKCCAFQHWVYQNTEGNLLITDMQGVGMRLTDVGIATCKKGYKGFRGNCSTSFIDQFKALHQCNKYCEILGLKSVQPKAKKASAAPKSKPQPSAATKKKTFGSTVKGKS
ncbi:alpha-protein kinase 2 [Melanotaenia boesemani]|uniref:alpha-protein kinase 2 n=1 Tax=Melanotaenia boesemani TaxID=1250792 RepID=UPI001C04F9A9|nr:alpha-protein kinase 2 [Melanotaenia boesemani]